MPAYCDESYLNTEVSVYGCLYGSGDWIFHMEEILKVEISFILDYNLRDVLIQLGSWWTRSHIEIGGSDSITKTIVEKLFSPVGATSPLHWI